MSNANDLPALDRYRIHAERLGKRFQDLSSEQVLKSVSGYLPSAPASIIDVGAGSGRDAAWFACQGHRVTAVEPVREMAEQAAKLEGESQIEWINDRLPSLAKLQDREQEFDICLLSGILHHLPEHDRRQAFIVLARLLRSGGRLIMSLRIGPDVDGRTNFAIDPDDTISLAACAGLDLIHRASAPSIQPANIAAGARWVWLVLERPKGVGT